MIALVAVICALILIQQTAEFGGGMLNQRLQNAMHIPWFACITVLVWQLLGESRVLLVVLICAGMAVLSEGLQVFTPRDASLLDLGRDTIGAVTASTGLIYGPRLGIVGRRSLWTGLILALGVLTLADPARVYIAYQHRDQLFPQLLEVGQWRQRPLLEINTPYQIITAPDNWKDLAGQPVLSLDWVDRAYPGITFLEVVPDWKAYDELVLDLYVPGNNAMRVNAAVGHEGIPGTSAYLSSLLAPGAHQVRLPLAQLESGRNGQPAMISTLIVHTEANFAGRTLWLGRVYLE